MTTAPEQLSSDNRVDLEYCRTILDGDIVSCDWTKRAVQRYLDDIENAEKHGWYFDLEAGIRPVEFCRLFCRHYQGEWVDQPLILSPWQAWATCNLFAFRKGGPDGPRRFSEAVVYVARKNGKTTWGAGLSLYATFFDNEPGSQGYYIATKEDQARIPFEMAKAMLRRSTYLQSALKPKQKTIESKKDAGESFLKPLGQDSDTLDGLNTHYCLVDEMHAQKDRKLYDIIASSMPARRQPLMVCISTAGESLETSLGMMKYRHAQQVLSGAIKDPSTFCVIYEVPLSTKREEWDWKNPELWPMANPNIGVSVIIDRLEADFLKRQSEPGASDEFRKKHCNQWLAAEELWIDMDQWWASGRENIPSEEDIAQMPAYMGLDLGRTDDFSSVVLYIPKMGGEYFEEPEWETGANVLRAWHFFPEDKIEERQKRFRVPLLDWVESGKLIPTPGKVTDYAYIFEKIRELEKKYAIENISFDPHYADQITVWLEQDGHEMIEVSQYFKEITGPTQELGKQIVAGTLAHEDCPVLAWMASNAVIRTNVDGYIKLDKQTSIGKIDGLAATVNAMATWMRSKGKYFASRYDDPEEELILV